jgi:hypothetical protein
MLRGEGRDAGSAYGRRGGGSENPDGLTHWSSWPPGDTQNRKRMHRTAFRGRCRSACSGQVLSAFKRGRI